MLSGGLRGGDASPKSLLVGSVRRQYRRTLPTILESWRDYVPPNFPPSGCVIPEYRVQDDRRHSMQDLATVAPAFIEMAHQIVWCSVATVDSKGRPRSRILHPIWQWDGAQLVGWVATRPTGVKRAHLAGSAYLSASYWAPTHDTCVADCRAIWANDDT